MLKQMTATLIALNTLCLTLQHCPAGSRYLVAVLAIGAIVYALQRTGR